MKWTPAILFLIFCFSAKAELVKIYHKNTKMGYQVLADNPQFCPVTVKFDFKLTNLKSTNDVENLVVIPAQSKGYVVTDLVVENIRKGYKFGMKSTSNFGDHIRQKADRSFLYQLPFKTNKKVGIGQGYNGKYSHRGENALDFEMAIGEEVFAARGGTVVEVVEKHSRNCTNHAKCAEYNNLIVIHHEDGTFAEYVHLKKNGAVVQPGDVVKMDQLIGYSGNTGFASGPHLHFAVYLSKLGGRETLRTQFKIDDGSAVTYLREGEYYQRQY